MTDFKDIHNRNLGTYAFVGGIAAINQRNRILQQQREQAAALERQHAELRAAEQERAATEAERLNIERQRFELEQLRTKIATEERALRQHQLDRLKEIRNFMADTITAFQDLQKQNP